MADPKIIAQAFA